MQEREIGLHVGKFFQEMDESCKNDLQRAAFLGAVSSAVGVFFHNNYEEQGYEEMASLFKKVILQTTQQVKADCKPHIHVTVNIQDRKK